jgi:hypothetical protein
MAASSGVKLGLGSTVRIGRGAGPIWTEIIGGDGVQFPDQTPDDVDVTWLKSPNGTEETIPGLKKVASWTLGLHYVPGSPTDLLLSDLEATGEDFILEITPVGGASHRWVAYVKIYKPTLNAKDKMTAEVMMTVKGKIGTVAAAAPVNAILPAISGVAQVGQTLMAFDGQWAQAASLAYQWQVDDTGWADIVGAVAQSFIPSAGHEGKALRVVVTATNSLGSTAANSGATADVLAA